MFKWAQLDLARQMESIDFIKEFMATMAKAGYNGILLYLEDRIRTRSYPYPKDSECYTPAQMSDLVLYAQGLQLEVVPCVATLGHAERFLAHEELLPLSELQGDAKGRFGGSLKQTFCPTNPDFYPFLCTYLKEVAEIFPSKFFHAGLDEFWDYCLCDRCKAAAPDFDAQARLFADHVTKMDECLKSFGKTMLMWSDMFEYYPKAQEMIPRDVILVDWQYHEDVRDYISHLFDAKCEDRLALNERLGFESFIAPVDMLFRNAQSYLEYAERRKFNGCIITSWEKTDNFLYRTFPTFVYAGNLMNGKSEESALESMMEQLFGTRDTVLASAVTLALTQGLWRHFQSISRTTLFSRDFLGLPWHNIDADRIARKLLKQSLPQIKTDLGRRIAEDMIDALEEKCISHALKRYFLAVEEGAPADAQRFETLRNAFGELMDDNARHWEAWRPGIQGNLFEEKKPWALQELDNFHNTLTTSKFVRVRCCVPDGYVVEHLRVSLKFERGGDWKEIYDGITKPQELTNALAEFYLPYHPEGRAEAIRIEAYGMGGIGVCYAEVDGVPPKSISSISGFVQNPEHLLVNNVNYAWFGSQSTEEAYFSKPVADTRHVVELNL